MTLLTNLTLDTIDRPVPVLRLEAQSASETIVLAKELPDMSVRSIARGIQELAAELDEAFP